MLVAPAALLLQAVATVQNSSGPYLVVGPPWVSLDQVILDAGGFPVGLMTPPLGRLAAGDDIFVETVRDKGAWFVANGRIIAAICGA